MTTKAPRLPVSHAQWECSRSEMFLVLSIVLCVTKVAAYMEPVEQQTAKPAALGSLTMMAVLQQCVWTAQPGFTAQNLLLKRARGTALPDTFHLLARKVVKPAAQGSLTMMAVLQQCAWTAHLEDLPTSLVPSSVMSVPIQVH